jgi:prepilin-type processing-associated H-X9-DG protein
MNAILKAAFMYAAENKDQWPPDLSALERYLGPVGKRVLINPLRPELKVGYIYVRPAAKMSDMRNLSSTIVLYEAHEKWGEGVWVGFADGHVQRMADQAKFKELLKKGK